MSEQPTGLEGLIKKLKDLRPHKAEGKQEKTSEEIAREAVLLFANQEHQEPLATYTADSDSIFELDKQKPGTILRINERLDIFSEPGSDVYSWYVLGSDTNGQADIFLVISADTFSLGENQPNYFMHLSPTLNLTETWSLKKQTVTMKSFPIKDATKALTNNRFDPFEDAFKVEKLDVMSAGKAAKVTERKPLAQPKLVPVTETA
jgi:hypothetical protein